MAYDENLAGRIRRVLGSRAEVSEMKMFSGLAFFLDGKMFCGIVKDDLMVRVGPERYEAALAQGTHVRPIDFTGRAMNGEARPSDARVDIIYVMRRVQCRPKVVMSAPCQVQMSAFG
jgi:hypothetical protein